MQKPIVATGWLVTSGALALCLAPLGVMSYQLMSGQFDPDPAKRLMQGTGEWALRGLAITLLATPLAQYGWRSLFQYRRMIGLTVFLYVSLHLLSFSQVYVGWELDLLLEELSERPYVLVGFAAWCMLMPLAATSFSSARRRLGRRWRQLHRLIYPATILAWFHLFWLSRSDVGEALAYGAIFLALLGWRLRRSLARPWVPRRD